MRRLASSRGWASLALVLAIALAVVASFARRDARAGSSDDGAPPGMVAWFSGATCPTGWAPHTAAGGRLLVGVSDGAQSGVTVGAPLNDREDRTHTHAWSGMAQLAPKAIAAADGSNNQGAAAQYYDASGTTDPATTGLPFQQLLACEKQ